MVGCGTAEHLKPCPTGFAADNEAVRAVCDRVEGIIAHAAGVLTPFRLPGGSLGACVLTRQLAIR